MARHNKLVTPSAESLWLALRIERKPGRARRRAGVRQPAAPPLPRARRNIRRCSGASMTEKTGVGQELAAAREARGLAVADVAQQLKFAPRQLEALEQEQFEALPGHTFTRGMVRNYARLLKLDPEPLVQRIAGRFEMPDSSRLARATTPGGAVLRPCAALDLGLPRACRSACSRWCGGVAYQWHQERTRSAATSASPSAQLVRRPRRRRQPGCRVAAAPVSRRSRSGAAGGAGVTAPVAPKPVAAPAVPKRWAGIAWWCAPRARRGSRSRTPLDRMLVSSLNPAGSERVVRGRPPYSLVIGNASQRARDLRRQADRPRAAYAARRGAPHPPMMPMQRRISRQVAVGGVRIGGGGADRRAVDDQHRYRGRAGDRAPGRGARARRLRARAHHGEHAARRRRRSPRSASGSTRPAARCR